MSVQLEILLTTFFFLCGQKKKAIQAINCIMRKYGLNASVIKSVSEVDSHCWEMKYTINCQCLCEVCMDNDSLNSL